MSEFTLRRVPPDAPLVFESRLIRLEGYESGEPEARPTWQVSHQPAFRLADGRRGILASGYLHTPGPYWGQAVVLGYLIVGHEFDEVAAGDLAARLLPGYVENMYDMGRRAINTLAAMMDGSAPGLPEMAPPIDLQPASEVLTGLDHDDDFEPLDFESDLL